MMRGRILRGIRQSLARSRAMRVFAALLTVLLVLPLFALLLLTTAYCQEPEPSDEQNQANPNSTTGVTFNKDYGRIVDCIPRSYLTVCAPSDSRFVTLFTSILGGSGETYSISPGQTLTLTDLRRSFWEIKCTTHSSVPVRFNLVGRTQFELQYRSTLPTALRDIYYPGRTDSYTLEFPYLSFLQQVAMGRLALASGNWTVNIDLRTRLCHTASDAALSPDCAGVTGHEGCADLFSQLLVARNSNNPGANCSSGACYWFAPPSRYLGENYHRSWRVGTLSLVFDWQDTEGTDTVQMSGSGNTVEGVQILLTPEPNDFFRLSASSRVFKGQIMMRKRTFFDRSQSLDPLGFPELGENELVFQETNNGVRLQTAVSAWFVGSPTESFLLRILNPDGSAIVISDIVEWYARRLFWRSSFPFSFSDWGYGYDHLGGQLGNIFIWEKASYSASLLPDYNPNSPTNRLGSQVMEMLFRPNYPNWNPTLVVGRARYEVFFPATGYRHPPGAISEPANLPIPNWFYYYWRAIGSPQVRFTNINPNPRLRVAGFYRAGDPHVYVRNVEENYTTTLLPLFAIRMGQCPEGTPANVVTKVDKLTVYGIHAFATTVYHEFGHKWSYETSWQVAPGVWMPIMGPRGRSGDLDGDGLLDAWEDAHGLCPHSPDTTDAYPQYTRNEFPSDPEVVADVLAYGALLSAESSPTTSLWRRDWSDKGLQYGNPLERFSAFPWRYESTNRNISAHPDLLTGWNP